jgi:hypothetical protein
MGLTDAQPDLRTGGIPDMVGVAFTALLACALTYKIQRQISKQKS